MSDSTSAERTEQRLQRNVRVVFALFAAWYVGRPVLDPFHYVVLRDIILATHEAGHLLFMPFGEFLMVLGGTLFQVLFPVVFVGYFARRRDWYAASIMLFWCAFALTDAAFYIGDARTRQLPLLGGDPAGHDWTFLLIQTGLLEQDRAIARLVRGAGLLVFATAIAGALYHAWWFGRERPDGAGSAGPPERGSVVVASSWRER